MSAATSIDGSGKGYIRLHRKILDNPLFKDKPPAWLKIWIYILLRANWRESVFRPRQGESIVVPAGSVVTSLEKLGTHAGLSKEHARRCLDYLERTRTVTLERTHQWTKITITNWAAYQQVHEEPQHTEQHASHHAERADATRETPQSPPHAATPSKEVKNLSKKNTSNSGELDSPPLHRKPARRTAPPAQLDPAIVQWFDEVFWPAYPRHEGRGKALQAAAAKATTPEKRLWYIERLKAQLPAYERRKRETGQHAIPMGSTWFEEDRAEDDLPPAPAGGSRQAQDAVQNDYADYVPLAHTGG